MARFAGLTCPDVPEHGTLQEVDGRLWCGNQAHDGRPSSHPLGPAPTTRSFFTLADAERPSVRVSEGVTQATVFSADVVKPINLTEDGRKTCTKCGDIYDPGEYGAHKVLPKHVRSLGQPRN